MASSDGSSTQNEQTPDKSEKKPIAINISVKIPRRKATLVSITLLLNLLHWSSVVCLSTSIYHISTHADDTTSIPSEVLTLTSGVASVCYVYLHTIISLKQKTWTHQREHASTIKKALYVAIRFVVSLCALWILTSGWNMIIVARRPFCQSDGPGLQAWEVGTSCRIARLGMAFAMISLIASSALFGVLAVVSRPFEAHLFKHGYEAPVNPFATPAPSRNASPVRQNPFASEKRPYSRRLSISTRRNESVFSIDTLDLSNSPPPPTLHAPSPRRSVGLGIFTSNLAPPPIPPEFVAPPRTTSLENLPALFQPSISHPSLTLPPRLSGQISSGGPPLSTGPQFSASTWRALHPTSPSSMGLASRSFPHLPNPGFSYPQHRYSRSSVSLTRPHRLSSVYQAASVTWSSRSGSTGPDGQDASTSAEDSSDERAPAKDIAFAILNGTPIPVKNGKYHMRTASAPDTTAGAQTPLQTDRMAMGWKPQLARSKTQGGEQTKTEASLVTRKPVAIVRSSSAEILNRSSADNSSEDVYHTPRASLERSIVVKDLPFRKSRSADTLVPRGVLLDSNGPEKLLEKSRVLHSESARQRRLTLDEAKNKPLPRIAML